MGLDAVEIVMEVEAAFDVRIPDDRACQIVTVGELYDLVVELKGDTVLPQSVCLSAATFYKIRRAICASLGLNPKTIRPRVSLESTIPLKHRHAFWSKPQSTLDLKLPELARPLWIVLLAAILTTAVSLWVALLVDRNWGSIRAELAFFAMLAAVGLLAAKITSAFEIRFRPEFATFRELSHLVLVRNYATLSKQFNASNSADVWDALKAIIVEQLGVKPEAVTKEAHFIADLGME